MKKLITITLIAFTFNCYSQNHYDINAQLEKEQKQRVIKADSLFAKKDYQHAMESYNIAVRHDLGDNTLKPKRDTCLRYYNIWFQEKSHTEVANNVIKRMKESGFSELFFDDQGKAISYKKKDGEMMGIDKLSLNTQKEISNVKRKDWESYQ